MSLHGKGPSILFRKNIFQTLNVPVDTDSLARSILIHWGHYHGGIANGVQSVVQPSKDEVPVKKRRTQSKATTMHSLLQQLNEYEMNMILHIVGKGDRCGEAELSEFISMHAGKRDLRIRNLISSFWTDISPDSGFDSTSAMLETQSVLEEQRKRIYAICGLSGATAEERLQAVCEPSELTEHQLEFVAKCTGVTVKKVDTTDIQRLILEIPRMDDDIRGMCRKDIVDLSALCDLAHKVRFKLEPQRGDVPQERQFSNNEMEIIKAINKSLKLPFIDLSVLRSSLTEMTYDVVRHGNFVGVSNYKKEVVAAWLNSSRFDFSIESLKVAARREAEAHTLAEFLGLKTPKAYGILDYSFGVSKEKSPDKGPSVVVNDDNFSGAFVVLPNGKTIRLDAIWDGMGGYANGSLASGIAKQIFEISAAAGWIQTPEDLRKVFVMADIAIVFKQLDNTFKKDNPEYKDSNKLGNLQQKDHMGTTAVITFESDDELFVINCGDSDFKLIDGDKNVYVHIPHDIMYTAYLSKYEEEAADMMRKKAAEQKINVSGISTASHLWFHQHVRSLAEQRINAERPPETNDNHVGSVLGGRSRYITINGRTYDFESIAVKRGQVKILTTDGLSDVACQHEYAYIVSSCRGDPLKIREKLMDLGKSRNKDGLKYELPCGCKKIGKNDDQTAIAVPVSLRK